MNNKVITDNQLRKWISNAEKNRDLQAIRKYIDNLNEEAKIALGLVQHGLWMFLDTYCEIVGEIRIYMYLYLEIEKLYEEKK